MRAQEELRTLTLVDEITGLYTRRGFLALVEQKFKIAGRLNRGVLLLLGDLDGLRGINDTLGYEEGDRALIEAANILKETFRESDIIARIGGDEFILLGIEDSHTEAEILSSRLQKGIEIYNAKRKGSYKLSISMGVARWDPESPCSIDDLLTLAERSVYEQKQKKGRGK